MQIDFVTGGTETMRSEFLCTGAFLGALGLGALVSVNGHAIEQVCVKTNGEVVCVPKGPDGGSPTGEEVKKAPKPSEIRSMLMSTIAIGKIQNAKKSDIKFNVVGMKDGDSRSAEASKNFQFINANCHSTNSELGNDANQKRDCILLVPQSLTATAYRKPKGPDGGSPRGIFAVSLTWKNRNIIALSAASQEVDFREVFDPVKYETRLLLLDSEISRLTEAGIAATGTLTSVQEE